MILLLHGNLKHQTQRSREQKVLFYRGGRWSWYRRNCREISQRTQKTIRKKSKNCQSQDPDLLWQAVFTWACPVFPLLLNSLPRFCLRLPVLPLNYSPTITLCPCFQIRKTEKGVGGAAYKRVNDCRLTDEKETYRASVTTPSPTPIAPKSNIPGRKPWREHFKTVIRKPNCSSPQLMTPWKGCRGQGLSSI